MLCIHILLLDVCLRGVVLFSFDNWMFAVVLFAFWCWLGVVVICLWLCCYYWFVNLIVFGFGW